MAANNVHPYLSEPDIIVLNNLFEDASEQSKSEKKPETSALNGRPNHDQIAIDRLKALNDPTHPDFEPTVFVSWDDKDFSESFRRYVVKPYTNLAIGIVRHPTDVVFLTHILTYLLINVPSVVWLFYNFTYIHGILHVAWTFWWTGSFTLMMHNHIHNNGVLAKDWAWLDLSFPYIVYPLMGHTWNSYYYHHVKHHHIEGNGPDDLSSTVRYQRDNVWHFLHYLGRFLFVVWLDLPFYFIRKGKSSTAAKAFGWEISGISLLYFMTTKVNTRAAVFTLVIPFVLLRLGLMIGNWGQHALVDDLEPDSDFRSSITLVDVPSNRFCFNDGYHTAHHLNSKRHWREQPVHFLQSKGIYREGRALTFHNIDYLMMTVKLLQKDYLHLASCLVPMGDQISMSQQEIADMLRTKTRRLTEEAIRQKFGAAYEKKPLNTSFSSVMSRFMALISPAVAADAKVQHKQNPSCATRPGDVALKERTA
ncbi:hypothetical protein DOTSEDRAFT_79442 [Dothistroma septosporum NZE10]|uniref:Fatty acid desaturase domain-containing protein n=1 Tax=Dothistroma septosporum (strain NZE10 / CBS 128990) TaxID=675120 RepID=N1PSW4_DOTSN|nr:hypothetical protein DOTSEDRAFT_79442 [Dothistroma septosporum NZE10]